MDHIHRLLDATSENDIQSRKKALTPQLLFSVLPWCVHESLPIASPELYCSSLSNKSNPAWKDEFVLSQMPMSKLLSSRKKQSKTEKDFPRIVYIRIQIFFHLLAKREFLANIHLQKNQTQSFLYMVPKQGIMSLKFWGKNYTGCYTEAKCQCPLAQAIKLTLLRKPTESLRIICHYKALRYTHFIFLRQRRVGSYLLVVFPCIHSFMKLIGLQLLNLHSGDLLLQIVIYYK